MVTGSIPSFQDYDVDRLLDGGLENNRLLLVASLQDVDLDYAVLHDTEIGAGKIVFRQGITALQPDVDAVQ